MTSNDGSNKSLERGRKEIQESNRIPPTHTDSLIFSSDSEGEEKEEQIPPPAYVKTDEYRSFIAEHNLQPNLFGYILISTSHDSYHTGTKVQGNIYVDIFKSFKGKRVLISVTQKQKWVNCSYTYKKPNVLPKESSRLSQFNRDSIKQQSQNQEEEQKITKNAKKAQNSHLVNNDKKTRKLSQNVEEESKIPEIEELHENNARSDLNELEVGSDFYSKGLPYTDSNDNYVKEGKVIQKKNSEDETVFLKEIVKVQPLFTFSNNKIERGHYQFPFSFSLPNNIGGSFYFTDLKKHSEIKYYIDVQIQSSKEKEVLRNKKQIFIKEFKFSSAENDMLRQNKEKEEFELQKQLSGRKRIDPSSQALFKRIKQAQSKHDSLGSPQKPLSLSKEACSNVVPSNLIQIRNHSETGKVRVSKFCCFCKSVIHISAEIDKNYYFPNDEIKINYTIDMNLSKVNLKAVEFHLKQIICIQETSICERLINKCATEEFVKGNIYSNKELTLKLCTIFSDLEEIIIMNEKTAHEKEIQNNERKITALKKSDVISFSNSSLCKRKDPVGKKSSIYSTRTELIKMDFFLEVLVKVNKFCSSPLSVFKIPLNIRSLHQNIQNKFIVPSFCELAILPHSNLKSCHH